MTSRHELLAELHKIVRPRVYLEVGVHQGQSLRLAHAAEVAIGIDPAPLVHPSGNQVIHAVTSDAYFEGSEPDHVDLAFIDGMHLAEYALRDYINIERVATGKTVIVFDDVLPRNQEEAARIQCPGDWTGDVWRTAALLDQFHGGVLALWVDTTPTGTFIVFGIRDPMHYAISSDPFDLLEREFPEGDPVPGWVLNRSLASTPKTALGIIDKFMKGDL